MVKTYFSKFSFQNWDWDPISLKNYSRPKLKSGFNEEWFSWQITSLMDLHSKTLLHQFHEFSSVALKKILKEFSLWGGKRDICHFRFFACPNFHLLGCTVIQIILKIGIISNFKIIPIFHQFLWDWELRWKTSLRRSKSNFVVFSQQQLVNHQKSFLMDSKVSKFFSLF